MISVPSDRPFGLAVAGSFLLLFACGGCGESREIPPAEGAPVQRHAVRVQVVENREYDVTEEVVGTVRPRLQARIEAKVSGRIEQMLAVPGKAVRAGDLLVRLDAQEIRARLDQAVAVRDQAEGDLRRLSKLVQRSTATQAELEAVQARAAVARAAVREAETMLGYTDIVAPFSGVVTRKLVDVGDLAGPGKPLLEMEDPAQLRFEAEVPEAIVEAVTLGAWMPVRLSGLSLALDGRVSELAPAADPNSRTVRVKLDLPQAAGLRSGQFGRVAVAVGRASGLRVPAQAVVRRGQMEMVFVLAGDRVQMRLVRTGKSFAGEVEILAGLDAGESVVIEGAGSLADEQPVEVKP